MAVENKMYPMAKKVEVKAIVGKHNLPINEVYSCNRHFKLVEMEYQ